METVQKQNYQRAMDSLSADWSRLNEQQKAAVAQAASGVLPPENVEPVNVRQNIATVARYMQQNRSPS